jgi:hypothetical protein
MKPEDKATWLKALRSGEYKKGSVCLYNAETGSYCALGLFFKTVMNWTPSKDRCCSFRELSNPNVSWTNALTDAGIPSGQVWNIIRHNDGQKSFGPVADYIEANL